MSEYINERLPETVEDDPRFWSEDDQNNLLALFKVLIEIDIKKNPDSYKSKRLSYENYNIRNRDSAGKAE